MQGCLNSHFDSTAFSNRFWGRGRLIGIFRRFGSKRRSPFLSRFSNTNVSGRIIIAQQHNFTQIPRPGPWCNCNCVTISDRIDIIKNAWLPCIVANTGIRQLLVAVVGMPQPLLLILMTLFGHSGWCCRLLEILNRRFGNRNFARVPFN